MESNILILNQFTKIYKSYLLYIISLYITGFNSDLLNCNVYEKCVLTLFLLFILKYVSKMKYAILTPMKTWHLLLDIIFVHPLIVVIACKCKLLQIGSWLHY